MIDRIRDLLEENDIEGVLLYLDLLEIRMQEIDDALSVIRKYTLVFPDYVYIHTKLLSGTENDVLKKVIK